VKITAAMAASLDILTAALDEAGTDIAHSLQQLAVAAAAAIPTYLGLSILVSHSNPRFICTTLADGVFVGDRRTSLQVLLPTMGAGHEPAVAVILYATAPGAFVDLAADLAWLTGRPPADFMLDQHLAIASGADTATQLQAASDINQAIGVLIGRGYSPRQADGELDAQAANNRSDRLGVARLILDKLTESDDDPTFGVY
jgi:hypothetical protein